MPRAASCCSCFLKSWRLPRFPLMPKWPLEHVLWDFSPFYLAHPKQQVLPIPSCLQSHTHLHKCTHILRHTHTCSVLWLFLIYSDLCHPNKVLFFIWSHIQLANFYCFCLPSKCVINLSQLYFESVPIFCENFPNWSSNVDAVWRVNSVLFLRPGSDSTTSFPKVQTVLFNVSRPLWYCPHLHV